MFASISLLVLFFALLMFSIRMQGTKRAPLISTFNIVTGLFLVYFFLPALLLITLNRSEYVWIHDQGGHDQVSVTLLVCIFSLACYVLGYFSHRPNPQTRISEQPHATHSIESIALALTAIGITLKVTALLGSGGIETNILRFSGGLKENLGIDSIDSKMIAIRNLGGIADAGATWYFLNKLRQKKKILLGAIIFGTTITITYFGAGKRLYLLWSIIAAAIGFHHYIKPIKISKLPLIGAITMSLGFLSLMFRIYVPANIAGLEIDLNEVEWAQGSIIKFYFLSLEFASFETLTLTIYQADRIVQLFGSTLYAFYVTNIEPFFYLVPRAVWPSKPELFLDLSHAYRVTAFGGSLDGQGGGIAATIIGTSWTIGGIVGLAISMLLLGIVCRRIDKKFQTTGRPEIAYIFTHAFCIVIIFHTFRQGTIGWIAVIAIVQQIGIIAGVIILRLAEHLPKRKSRSE